MVGRPARALADQTGSPAGQGDRPAFEAFRDNSLCRKKVDKIGGAAAMTGIPVHHRLQESPMAILAESVTKRSAANRFRSPPWHEMHPAKGDIEQRLAPGHPARFVEQAVARLDRGGLYASYGGTGSLPHPPDRLLRVVLYEMRRGHHTPAEWHRDARECEPVRWLLRGATVARSCWYTFRDRVGPWLLDLNQQVLRQAIDAGITPATRGVEDGTLVAANTSRHQLVNQATLDKRAALLAAALQADQAKADQAKADQAKADPSGAVASAAIASAPDRVVSTAAPTLG